MRLKKILSAIAASSLLLTLGVSSIANDGAKQVRADDEITSPLVIDGTAKNISFVDGAQTIEVGGVELKGTFKQYSETALFFTAAKGYIYNTTPLGNIKKISIAYKSGGSSAAKQAISLDSAPLPNYLSAAKNGTTLTASTGGETGEYQVTGDYAYFNISVSNKNLQASSITIEFEKSSGKNISLLTRTELGFSTEYTKTGEEEKWELVTDNSQLVVGDSYAIAALDSDYAMSTNQKTNNRDVTAITKENNTMKFNENVQVLTLENGVNENTFAFSTGNGYLYAAGTKENNNYLKTKNTKDASGSFAISIGENGSASIIASGDSIPSNIMRYNTTSTLFACYASGKQDDICLYKKSGGLEYSGFDTFENFSLRFSTIVSAENVSEILLEGETEKDLTYGFLVAPAVFFEGTGFETFAEAYASNPNYDWENELGAINVTYSGSRLETENNIGVIINHIPENDIEEALCAVAYVIASDGTYYFANQTEVSVKTAVVAYMEKIADLDLTVDQITALKKLNEYLA